MQHGIMNRPRISRLNENVFLLLTLLNVLIPSNNINVLILFGLSQLIISLYILKYINLVTLQFSTVFMLTIIFINFIFFNIRIEIFKPIWSFLTIMLLVSCVRVLSENFYRNFIICMFLIIIVFFLLFMFEVSALTNFYRVTDQGDLIHRERVTAPFLFAGDFGLAALFLAVLCVSVGSRFFTIIGLVFLLLLLFSQSRIALACLPFVFLFFKGTKHKIFGFLTAIVVGILLIFFLEEFLNRFPYFLRFYDNFEFYVFDSKRAEEYLFVYDRLRDLIFSGSEDFVLRRGLTTAESSMVSYIAKIGIVPTFIFWAYFLILTYKKLGNIYPLCLMLFLLAFVTAPLDRPKSSFIIIICIAGASKFRNLAIGHRR